MALTRVLTNIAVMIMISVMTAGCGAHFNSIHRSVNIPADRARIQFIDAKQRAILSTPVEIADSKIPSTTVTRMIFCAEPSPDVFAVNAAAATANGTLAKSGSPVSVNAGFGFSGSSSEQAATIARTQTVNLLKELMFRTCERYLNNGIGPLELSVQAARDQRLIVATLAIEQLTGAILTKATIIGASGSASGGGSAADAIVRIDDAWKDKQSADAAAAKAQSDYDKLNINGEAKDCEAIAKEPDPAKLTEEQKKKVDSCPAALAAKTKADKRAADATAHHNSLKGALDAGGGLVTQAATEVQNASGNGGLDQASVTNVQSVALAVQAIVEANYRVDEFELVCLKVFERDNATDPLLDECVKYMRAKVDRLAQEENTTAARLALEQVETANALAVIQSDDRTSFDIFWNLDKDERDARIKRALQQAPVSKKFLNRIKLAPNRAAAEAAYNRLVGTQARLILDTKAGD